MKVIRIVFGLVALTWFVGVMAFGAGMTWISNDPDAAAGVALGAVAVDANAGVLENAESFAGGFAVGRDLSVTAREMEAKESLRNRCSAHQDSDWGAPPECAALLQWDMERDERLKSGW